MKEELRQVRHYFRILLAEISIEEIILNSELIENAKSVRTQLLKAS